MALPVQTLALSPCMFLFWFYPWSYSRISYFFPKNMPSVWTNFDNVFKVSRGVIFDLLLEAKICLGNQVDMLYHCDWYGSF